MITDKSWCFKSFAAAGSLKLEKEFDLSSVTAGLLYERGINTKEKARKFLHGTLKDLAEPWEIHGMKQAVIRIEKAIFDQEKIIIYGDYDVDGICSIVIVKECIEMLGGAVDYYVPDRFQEGYGINIQAIDRLLAQQYKLMISVDCGITAVEEVNYAQKCGMDMIITDHHTPGEILPSALAVVNPLLDDEADNNYLCGAGVAYKLALALQQKISNHADDNKWLDLVALATVADVVPLLGDNHILVKYGLKILEKTGRTGLKALLREVELENRSLTVWQIGFVLAPRLNAAGRLDSARKSVELLMTQDERKAADLAACINKINDERRQIEENIYKQALNDISEKDLSNSNVIIVAGDNWHQGVIGIVASRLCDKFYRPVIVISWNGNDGKGSGRSIKGFNLYDALKNCNEHLEHFGGHQMAAGLSIVKQEFASFVIAVNEYSKKTNDNEWMQKTCWADGELDIKEINNKLIEELKVLEPFGEGNPKPGFILRNLDIHSLFAVGSQKEHVKFNFFRDDIEGIAFRRPEYINFPYKECYHDIIGEIDEAQFRGKKTFQIKVREMKSSFVPDNIKNFTGFETEPYLHLKRIITEIRSGRPVIVLFPTVRCLLKYKPALDHCIRSRFISCLHGHLDPGELQTAIAHLLKGRAKAYLMTAACLEKLLNRDQLPDTLKYVLPVWPWEFKNVHASCSVSAEKISFKHSEEEILSSMRFEWNHDNKKRTLIYCNRRNTVEKLVLQIPEIIIEAAVDDINRRNHCRRIFEEHEDGVFLTDGNYSIGTTFDRIDEVVMADLPFSIQETMFMLDQVTSSQLKILIPFIEEKQKINSAYINERYPDEAEVKMISNYFLGLSDLVIRKDLNELLQLLANDQGISISRLKLLSILRILADLGLCQISKKGSIMEIKSIAEMSWGLDLNESLFYQEGIAEKKAWSDLIKKIRK